MSVGPSWYSPTPPPPAPKYRTQKAQGVAALKAGQFYTPTFEVFGVEKFMDGGMNGVFMPQDLVNRFVRPCPLRPRHGFVESRAIKSVEEAVRIILETVEAEPDAELLVMPFINADYSAVWTPGLLSVGRGHDGATAGTSSRAIPVMGKPRDSFPITWEEVMKTAGITESPYVELLWERRNINVDSDEYYDETGIRQDFSNFFVQLRNGPNLPQTVDFLPAEVEVKHVLYAEGDLLEWEARMKEVPEGTVVYHPRGSLASHYSVHAVLNNVPVLISRKPTVGETLVQSSEVKVADLQKVRAGFIYGATCPDLDYYISARAMLAACHSTALWTGRQDALLGFGMGCAFRLTVTAGLGEMRHHRSRRRKAQRDSVYKGVWDNTLDASVLNRYLHSLDSYQNDNWAENFGGVKWYEFTRFARFMYDALVDGDVIKALESLNHLVHAAHNGGWGFDKFIGRNELDETAHNPLTTVLRCAPSLYEAIVAVEQKPSAARWFTTHKRLSDTPIDIEAAKAAMAEEDKNGRLLRCCKCGDQLCVGDAYDGRGCTYKPSPCDASYGCANPECTKCTPSGKVIAAQAKLVKFAEPRTGYLFVEYLREHMGKQSFLTKRVLLKPAQFDEVTKQMFARGKNYSYSWMGSPEFTYLTSTESGEVYLGSIHVEL